MASDDHIHFLVLVVFFANHNLHMTYNLQWDNYRNSLQDSIPNQLFTLRASHRGQACDLSARCVSSFSCSAVRLAWDFALCPPPCLIYCTRTAELLPALRGNPGLKYPWPQTLDPRPVTLDAAVTTNIFCYMYKANWNCEILHFIHLNKTIKM